MDSKKHKQNNTDLVSTILQSCPIAILPDDCLTSIFSLLPILDRIKIQKVCKRWCSVGLSSWYSMKTLNFNQKDWGISEHNWVTRDMLMSALESCGAYVTVIDFSEYCPDYYVGPYSYRDLLKEITKLCPNLKSIRLAEIQKKPIEFRAKAQSNLGELDLMTNRCDKVVSFLFRNNQFFRGLNVLLPALRNERWSDSNLLNEDINLIASFINLNICKIQDKFPNYVTQINEFLESFSPYGDKLDSIKINCTYNLGNLKLEHFEHFQNLRNLILRGQGIHMDMHFSETCLKHCTKLNYIQLQDITVTNTELLKIIELPELRELHLLELSEVTDAIFLSSLPSLVELQCYRCPQIKNSGLSELLRRSARNLKILKLHRCENVDIRRIIQDAKAGTDTRTNGPLLHMSLTGMHILFTYEIKTRISRYLKLTITRYYNYSEWF